MLSQSQIKYYWAPRCSGPWATVSLYGAGKVTVDAAIVPAVKALNQVLTAYKYYTRYADTGAYNCRRTASGSWSLHAYSIAMDINWQTNPYSRYLRTDMFKYGDGRMPHRICAIRTNNGKQIWNWGGFWSGSKDAMHYEIVCSPADLRTGINWSTVYGYNGVSLPAPKPTPTPTTGELVYRIYWLKNGSGPTEAHRCLCGKAEKSGGWIIWSTYWIKNPDELKIWRDRGLFEANTGANPILPRATYEIHGGTYDNTKTF